MIFGSVRESFAHAGKFLRMFATFLASCVYLDFRQSRCCFRTRSASSQKLSKELTGCHQDPKSLWDRTHCRNEYDVGSTVRTKHTPRCGRTLGQHFPPDCDVPEEFMPVCCPGGDTMVVPPIIFGDTSGAYIGSAVIYLLLIVRARELPKRGMWSNGPGA